MRSLKTITILEILKLFKKHLELDVQRSTVYTYIKTKGFPCNTGLGVPRRWRKDQVMKWINDQIKKSDALNR